MKKVIQDRLAVSSLAILLGAPLSGAGGDWPQWRGPDRTDVSPETGLLKEWPAGGPKRIWLYKNAGNGYSGPAILNGKLFTMGTRDGAEIMVALNASTGEELWTASIGPMVKFDRGGGPRGTPTVDGERIYGLGGQGSLVCASAADGKVIWRVAMADLGGKTPGWGYSESVLVDGDKVVCTPGGSKGAEKLGRVRLRSRMEEAERHARLHRRRNCLQHQQHFSAADFLFADLADRAGVAPDNYNCWHLYRNSIRTCKFYVTLINCAC